MWLQFFAQNAHFAINLFASLVCMGITWLYIDSWSNRHNLKELFKWTGFAVLSVSFLLQATIVEQSVLGSSVLGHWTAGGIVLSRLAAYALIILGQLSDPLQAVPDNKGLELESSADSAIVKVKNTSIPSKSRASKTAKTRKAPALVSFLAVGSKILMPLGGLAIAVLYWRRATTGLERHLKPIAKAFLLFALSDLIGLAAIFRTTTNPIFYTWVAAFGLIWWLQQLALLSGVIILGLWTWGYLVERFFSQLFMILTTMVVVVFLVVSVGFTGLLLRNIRAASLTNLNTAANVLDYALKAKQGETASAAQQLADNASIAAAISNNDRAKLKTITANYLVDKKLTDLVITNDSGQVMLRAQDTERFGDSLSSDALIKRVLLGVNQSTVSVVESVASPVVQVRSASAVHDNNGVVVGGIVAVLNLDSSFVDGLKKSTGLQSSVYGGNTLAATTLTSADGKTRTVGVKLTSSPIKDTVLKKGQSYSGNVNLQNRQMLAVFLPIKDVDNAPVGMLLIAEPQSAILLTAGRSVELTFILTAVFMLLSTLPIFYIVKALTKQLD